MRTEFESRRIVMNFEASLYIPIKCELVEKFLPTALIVKPFKSINNNNITNGIRENSLYATT